MQGYWHDVKTTDLNTLPDGLIAILPLGATEQHGPHLPLGTDTVQVNAVLAALWPLLPPSAHVLALPTLAITKSDEHRNFPGTLAISAHTMLAMLDDICASLARSGITRLLMLNGHGGNTALLEIAARSARGDHGLIAAHAAWFAFADYTGFDEAALAHDLHAGDIETSAMLHIAPDLVDRTQAQDFTPKMRDWEAAGHLTGLTGQPARPGWLAEDLGPSGAIGNASAATAEKGAQLIGSAAKGLAAYLQDFARFDGRAP